MRATPLPPSDWADVAAWDQYHSASVEQQTYSAAVALRFSQEALRLGGRTWLPGCGLDPAPRALSALGCSVRLSRADVRAGIPISVPRAAMRPSARTRPLIRSPPSCVRVDSLARRVLSARGPDRHPCLQLGR